MESLGKRRVTFLTDSLSSSAGGLFEAMRSLSAAIERGGRYVPRILGVNDSRTKGDAPLWGTVTTKALSARGPRTFGYAPELYGALLLTCPEVLHVHGLWTYSSVATIRWARTNGPYIVSPHGMLDPWALRNSRWKKVFCAALYENRHLNGASCLHALTRSEAETMREYGLRNPICVIPNGVTIPIISEVSPPKDKRTLLYLGRLHPKKGLVSLIRALFHVHRIVIDAGWKLLIAGWDQNGHRRELENLVDRLAIRDIVSFAGPQFGLEKDASFQSASALILPSLSEGLPISILEAWAWNLPVLMTPECNLPEGSAAGAAIMMQTDQDSISGALVRLISMSESERVEMGLRGRRLVQESFCWDRVSREMTGVYDWISGDACPSTLEILL